MKGNNTRILSLDAGGMKGIYTLSIIDGLERQSGLGFNNLFDYYVGSSIGAVVATALAIGVPVTEIRNDFYSFEKNFHQGHFYLLQRLYKWIDERFGDKRMSEVSPKLFLPVYNYSTRQSTFFFNNEENAPILISDVLKASCADIRISPPHMISGSGHYYSDAGFFAYDPTLFFLRSKVLALNNTLNILSIGSGIITNLSSDLSHGETFDIIYDSFIEEQFQATSMLFEILPPDQRPNYLRVSEFPYPTDKQVSIADLVWLAEARVQTTPPDTIKNFLFM